MKFKILFFLAITLSFTACSDSKPKKSDEATAVVIKKMVELSSPSEAMTAIRMQKWALLDYQFNGKGTLVQLEKKPYLIFRDGRASGFAGCNSFSGEYVEGEDMALNFKPINITKKACEKGYGDEVKFIDLLQNASEYSLSDENTKLKIISTNGVLNFILK